MLRRYWTLLVLLLAPLLPLGRPIFLGETIGPVEQFAHMAPWNGPEPDKPWDVVQADAVLQFLPWRDMVFRAWRAGEVPLWNRYELAGTPLLASSQSGALYPPHILAGFAHAMLGTPILMALLAWLHLALAGIGTSLLCRRLGGSEGGGLIAGLTFVFSAFLLSWTSLPSVLETVTWIPWALAAVTGLIDGTEVGPKLRSAVGLSLAVGMMVLGGHLQFVAYGAMAIVVLGIGRAIAHRPKTSVKATSAGLGLSLLGLLLGFMLAAPQLLPVLEFSKQSHRRNVATEQGYEDYSRSAIRMWELGGFVYPKLNGDPTAFAEIEGQKLSSYWPQYVRPGANFAESALGLGPLVVCLLMCTRLRAPYWRELSPLIFCGFLALLLALGSALGRVLYFGLPGWSATGSPGRASVVFVLAACVAAGVVASQPLDLRERRRIRYAPVAGFLVLTIACIYFVKFGIAGMQAGLPNLNADTLTTIVSESTRSGIAQAVIAALVTAVAVGLWLRSGRTQLGWLLAPIAITPFLVVPPLIRSGTRSFELKDGGVNRVAVFNEGWNLFSTPKALLPPNLVSLSNVQELGGYDSLLDKDTKTLLDDIDGQGSRRMAGSTPVENGNMVFVTPTADLRKVAEAGVTEVWSERPDLRLGSAPEAVDGSYRYLLAGPGRVSLDSQPLDSQAIHDKFSRFEATARGPGRFVLRDRNMPGWTATVDGKATKLQGSLWRELDLGPGEHKIVMRYSPPGFRNGLLLFGAGLIALVALGLSERERTRQSSRQPI